MNKDQFLSLLRSVLKSAGTGLATHGYLVTSSIFSNESIIGAALFIGGLLWSHWHHDNADNPSPPSYLKLLFFCAIPAFGLCTLPACKSPELTAYKTTAVVTTTVDTAMQAWGDYVRAGKSTPEQEAKVKAAYNHYRALILVARDIVLAYKANQNAPELQRATAAIGAACADVISVVNEFTKK